MSESFRDSAAWMVAELGKMASFPTKKISKADPWKGRNYTQHSKLLGITDIFIILLCQKKRRKGN